MVGEGVVFQGMRGYTVPLHAPAVACFTMSVTQHIWLKKKYYRVPIFNPVVSEATRLSFSCFSDVCVTCSCFRKDVSHADCWKSAFYVFLVSGAGLGLGGARGWGWVGYRHM